MLLECDVDAEAGDVRMISLDRFLLGGIPILFAVAGMQQSLVTQVRAHLPLLTIRHLCIGPIMYLVANIFMLWRHLFK